MNTNTSTRQTNSPKENEVPKEIEIPKEKKAPKEIEIPKGQEGKKDKETKKDKKAKKDKEARDYKVKQKEELDKYKVGALDSNDYKIINIFGEGDEYVIYEIETNHFVNSVKVFIKTLNEDDKTPIQNYSNVRAKFTEVKSLLYKVVDKQATKTIIAHILINAILGRVDLAHMQFDQLIKQINLEYKEQFDNRIKFLFSALAFTILIIYICISIYYRGLFNNYNHIHNLFFVICGGCMGGFFSISIGINKLICEKDVGNWVYYLFGLERIIVAILAASIIYFAIQCDLAFSFCKKLDNPVIGYLFFGILAGFSESLVPNLLSDTEKKKYS